MENALLDVPEVKEAAVKADSRGDHDMLTAWVVLEPLMIGAGTKAERQQEEQEMKRRLRAQLAGRLSAVRSRRKSDFWKRSRRMRAEKSGNAI